MEKINVGFFIRSRRIELGLTQAELAKKIGRSSQVISNWERGYSPSIKMIELAKVAEALQVNVGYFFPSEKPKDNRPPRSGQAWDILNIYPTLDEYTKDIIDAIIRVAKKK